MVCENAGRWARIHDIYISVILKPFLGNRIGYKPLPVLRAVCPCSSFVPPPHRSVLPCRWGWKIAFMIKQPIVLTIMRLIVAFLPCRFPCRASRRCSRPAISSVHLIRPSRHALAHPVPCLLSRCFARPRRLFSSRSSPRCPDKQGGACLRIPYRRPRLVRLGSSDVVGCRDVPWDVARCGIR